MRTFQHVVIDIETAPLPGFASDDRAALDPTRARIVAIGLKNDQLEEMFAGDDERKVLDDFWAWMNAHEIAPVLVAYNGLGFDMIFLRIRSMVHGLKPFWLPKLTCLDLMEVLFPNGNLRKGKDAVCDALGILANCSLKGSDVPRLVAEGDYASVKRHCRDDIRREWELFRRMSEAGVV